MDDGDDDAEAVLVVMKVVFPNRVAYQELPSPVHKRAGLIGDKPGTGNKAMTDCWKLIVPALLCRLLAAESAP